MSPNTRGGSEFDPQYDYVKFLLTPYVPRFDRRRYLEGGVSDLVMQWGFARSVDSLLVLKGARKKKKEKKKKKENRAVVRKEARGPYGK